MRNHKFFLNTALAVTFGLSVAVCILIRTFSPSVVLPRLNIPGFVLISLPALLLEHYFSKDVNSNSIWHFVLSACTFGLFLFLSGFANVRDAVTLSLIGAVVFTVTSFLFHSIIDRLSTGPVSKAAPILSALGLYLASQCFSGILL